jgi:hypothetical protein
LKDLDTTLLRTPVVRKVYELFFRIETYYREDCRLMFVGTVRGITNTVVEEVTAAKGIKMLKRYERKPIAGDLYAEAERPLPSATTAQAAA